MKFNTEMIFSIIVAYFSVTSNLVAGEQAIMRIVPEGTRLVKKGSLDDRINCDFAEPTDLRDVARAFSLWFGKTYEVDESIEMKVRLHSPEPVSKSEALKRFYQMLALNDLRVLDEGEIIKIKPVGNVTE